MLSHLVLLEDVVNFVDALVQDLSDVLDEVGQLQEVRELHLDVQSLQEESDVLDVEDVLLVIHFARLVVDYHLELEHLRVIRGDRELLLFDLVVLVLLEQFCHSQRNRVILCVVVQIPWTEHDWVDGILLRLVVDLEVTNAELDLLQFLRLGHVHVEFVDEDGHQLAAFVND